MYPGKEYQGVEGGIYRLVQNLEQFEWFYERARKQPRLVLDTETSGLSWVKDHACGVVIGWGVEHNYYLAIDHIDHITGLRLTDQLNWLDIYEKMKVLLENPKLVILFHNGKFDQHMMANLGIYFKGVFHDSLLSSFLLDENAGHGLKELSVQYVAEDADKFEKRIDAWRLAEAKRRRMFMSQLIKETMLEYKKDSAYIAECTKRAVAETGFKLDENGKAEKGAKAKLTRTITSYLKERAQEEHKDHLYNANLKDDISYDLIPLDEMTPYACADVHYTWIINELLLPALAESEDFLKIYVNEIELCKNLMRIERKGVKIDKEYLAACGPELEAEAARLEETIYEQIGYRFNIGSTSELTTALQQAGCDLTKLTKGSRKKVEKTGDMSQAKLAVDAEVMEELGAKHQFAYDVLSYRRALKIKGTYVDGILSKLDDNDHVHCTIRQNVSTGRMASSDPNLTNIDGKDTRIRRSFIVPSPDVRFVFMDMSQIELRLTAHESRDPELLACYPWEGKGKDVHSLTCAEVIMNMDYDEFLANMKDNRGHDDNAVACECNECVFDAKRKIAKRVNFGIIYGAWKYTIQRQVSTPARYVSADECGRYIDGYLRKYTGVAEWIEETGYELKRNGFVSNGYGRVRRLPDALIRGVDKQYLGRMQRQAVNFKIQSMAADMFKQSINRVSKIIDGTGIEVVNLVHDDIQFYWPENRLDLIPDVKAALEDFDLLVPVVADVSISNDNWANKKKWAEAKAA